MYLIFIYPLGLALGYLIYFRLGLPFIIMALCERAGISSKRAGIVGVSGAMGLWFGLLYLASIAFGHLVN